MKPISNKDVKEYAKAKGVAHYEVAEKLKISEPTFSRWLRKEFNQEQKKIIFGIIDEIAKERAE